MDDSARRGADYRRRVVDGVRDFLAQGGGGRRGKSGTGGNVACAGSGGRAKGETGMISLLLPTRKRPKKLAETIESVRATAENIPEILCYVSDCDDSYDRLITESKYDDFPWSGFVKFIRGPRVIMSDLWNVLVPHARGDIFMLCADDVLFRTPGWDVEIEKAFAAVPDRILLAYADDGGPNGKAFATLPFVSREWVDAVGYFTGPGFSADYSDTWPNDVAEMVGRKKFVPVLIEHMHWMWEKAQYDEVYAENQSRLYRDKCREQYDARITERQRDAEKLRTAIARHASAVEQTT